MDFPMNRIYEIVSFHEQDVRYKDQKDFIGAKVIIRTKPYVREDKYLVGSITLLEEIKYEGGGKISAYNNIYCFGIELKEAKP